MTKKENNILLFSITLCWASSYVFIKDLPPDLSSYAYLTLTAGIAGVIMLVVFWKKLRQINRATLLRGLVLAGLLAGNMLLEKQGLSRVPSSTASFLASLNIVIVPVILLFMRKFPTRNNVLGIAVILGGLLLSNGIALSGEMFVGMLYMLGACALMSVYTVVAAEFTKKSDPLLLSVLQICFSALIGFVLWFMEDQATFAHIAWSKRMLSSIFILAFFSKAYAYIMLMYAEKYADAISVTIIASLEPVVTLVLALLIPNAAGQTESFSGRALAGAVVIAVGAIVAGLDFLSKKKGPDSGPMEEAALTEEMAEAPETGTVMEFGVLKQFLIIFVPFVVLGAAFKVMVLVEGFTEVRPENAIPVIGGLLFGPVGALGCGLANVVADFFGTLNATSILGLIGNATSAYIPYRLWHALRSDDPSVSTWRGMAFYVWISFISAVTCASILGFGLELFFGMWIDTIYRFVFLNNFGFSVALGMPLFVVARSDSINICPRRPKKWEDAVHLPLTKGQKTFCAVLYTLTQSVLLVGVLTGHHLGGTAWMKLFAACSLALLAVLLMAPVCRESAGEEDNKMKEESGLKGKKVNTLTALLVLNLLLSLGIIVYLAANHQSPAEAMQVSDKYTIYIGTNDRETYTQLIGTKKAEKMVNEICARYVDGYTESDASGGWVDETGTLTEESTLVYAFYNVSWEDLTKIMDDVLVELNQNSILIEHENTESTYYDRTNLEIE